MVGGGCTSRNLPDCAASTSYSIYADSFAVADVYSSRFSVIPPAITDSLTQFGDSGGPVVVGSHFLGILSTKFGALTYVQRITGGNF